MGKKDTMRKLLIGFIVIVLLVLGAAWWLAGQAENGMPDDGEIRIDVENIF